jgi:hypothetical protein
VTIHHNEMRMRRSHAWLLVLGLLAGCATNPGAVRPHDAAVVRDTGTNDGAIEAGVDAGSDAALPADTGTADTGPVDTGPIDTGPPQDSGMDGTSCMFPVDVTATDAFVINTCTAVQQFMSTCGSPTARATILQSRGTGSTNLRITDPGWTIQQLDELCRSSGPLQCTTLGNWNATGATYFAISRTDGTCGTVTITVTHR